ncbi:phage portal protein family protein [Pseudomonas aeruginosa]
MIAEKSRRTGLTWAEAGRNVINAAKPRRRGGCNTFYVGSKQEMALEYIAACALFARAFNELAEADVYEQTFWDEGKKEEILTYMIRFPKVGAEIQALSSRPSNLRGLQGDVVIDEAAFHESLEELLKAALALTMWGNKVRLISTHNGVDNPFNQYIQDAREGRKDYSVHRITLDDAIAEGLYKANLLRHRSGVVARGREGVARSGCTRTPPIPSPPTRNTAASRRSPAAPTSLACSSSRRWSRTIRSVSTGTRRRKVSKAGRHRCGKTRSRTWCEENLLPELARLDPENTHSFGEDFARRGDLTVFTPLQISPTLRKREAFRVELRNLTYEAQRDIMFFICDRLPRVVGMAFDATGNGGYLAEQAALRYGPAVVEQVSLNLAWYAEWMPKLEGEFEAFNIELSRHQSTLDDLLSIKVENGIPVIDKGRKADLESAGGKAKRHGDSAVSLVMAVRASYMAGRKQPIECQSAGRRASAQQDLAGTRHHQPRLGHRRRPHRPRRLLMHPPKLGQEIATTGDGRDITRPFLSGLQQPSDYILQRRGGNDLRIYEEVLRDAQVKATWGQRQLAVVSKEWQVDAGGDRRIDKAAAEHLKQQLQNVGWDRITNGMLYGVYYGHAVSELIYGRDDRYITLQAVKVRNRRRFRYDLQGGLRLLTPNNMFEGEPCPSPYFWHFSTGADNDDEPYGLGLAHWLYWPVYFKRNGLKFWLTFLDKFGMPTAVGKFGKNATPEEKAKLLAATQAIQTDTGVIMPEDMLVELLEASRSGTADYKILHDTMDETIAKVTLGQVASSQGTPGRLGNDDLQADVRLDLVKADADLICESFNQGPARWLTEWNFPGAEPPCVYRVVEEPEDMDAKASRDEKVVRFSGFKPTLGYVQETYGIEVQEQDQKQEQGQPTGPSPAAEFAERAGGSDPAAAMTDQLAKAMQPAVKDWSEQLRALVDNATSLDELQEQLLQLAPELSLDQYAAAMAVGLQAANLAGRTDVQDDLAARGSA